MSEETETPNSIDKTTYVTISCCRCCGSSDIDLLIDYGSMPLAGGFMRPDQVEKLNISYPLRLARCNHCTVMQVLDSIPPEKIFSQYSYASSTTRTLIEHFTKMGKEIVKYADAKGKLIVEFGCNDGILIKPLVKAGAKGIGVDPSDVALVASSRDGWNLYHEFLTPKVALEIVNEHGKARVVTGNNVFAHVNNIHEILEAATILLDEKGFFIIEVHYQGSLIETIQFDTVYHEHIFYYSVKSLKLLFESHGLRIIEVQKIPIHAGSIRVIAAKINSNKQATESVNRILYHEDKIDISLFVDKVKARRSTIQKIIYDLHKAGKSIIAYGAAGRMTIMLNYCQLGNDIIRYVQDMSPLRFGKIVPGVLIPIISRDEFLEELPDYAIMTAWNYEQEIVKKENKFLINGGRFIVPLPDVRIVGEV